MSDLDELHEKILVAWAHGRSVIGYGKGVFGIQNAMQDAVTGPYAKEIAGRVFAREPNSAGLALAAGIRLVARELAASHMGYPYLPDAEAAMKGQESTAAIEKEEMKR